MMSSVPKHDVEKFRWFLDSRSDKSIPASAFMEMLVHFRDHPKALKKIISFREEKELKVLNNFHGYCFTPDELTMLHITKENAVLQQYAYMLLEKKIEIEVSHSYVFLQVVSLIYADYYLKSCDSLSDETKERVLLYLGRDMSNGLKEDLCLQLTAALKSGYADNNKSQQYLKKKYIELLVQNCVIIQMIIDTVCKYLDDDENLFDVMCRSAADAKNNGFTDDKIMEVIKTIVAEDPTFLKYAENEISDIFYRKGYSKHQSQYLKTMLEAWLERGQKLIKNDIFDMLCVGVLDNAERNPSLSVLVDQNSYLISFDEAMMKFISNDSGNAKLLDKFMIAK